jgi:hypothetical protein
LLARRLARVVALLIVAGILAAGVVVFFKSHKDAAVPAIQAEVVHRGGHDLVSCSGGGFGTVRGEAPEGTTPEEFCAEFNLVNDPRFHMTAMRDAWLGLATQLIIVAWLIGASFIGAEWHSGTMTTLLTWEPRRVRVFFAKLLACMFVVFVVTILAELLLGAALYPAAAFRGTTAGADGAWAAEGARLIVRAGLVCSLAAGIGYGLATIGRNTAAALGGGFVYLLVIESLVRGLRPGWAGWLLGDNIANFLGGAGHKILDRSPLASGVVIAVYCGAALTAGLALFTRRDVT